MSITNIIFIVKSDASKIGPAKIQIYSAAGKKIRSLNFRDG
jgi:hypothetical protein